jgi:hypothetical protein
MLRSEKGRRRPQKNFKTKQVNPIKISGIKSLILLILFFSRKLKIKKVEQ